MTPAIVVHVCTKLYRKEYELKGTQTPVGGSNCGCAFRSGCGRFKCFPHASSYWKPAGPGLGRVQGRIEGGRGQLARPDSREATKTGWPQHTKGLRGGGPRWPALAKKNKIFFSPTRSRFLSHGRALDSPILAAYSKYGPQEFTAARGRATRGRRQAVLTWAQEMPSPVPSFVDLVLPVIHPATIYETNETVRPHPWVGRGGVLAPGGGVFIPGLLSNGRLPG